jgi:membrane protein YqaA with SNARE-associated domain
MATLLLAVLWGFGEATLFFIVPDVLLSVIALRDRRAGWNACGAAIAGALAGGLLMFVWGRNDPAGANAALLRVPAVGPEAIRKVHDSLGSSGLLALFVGPLTPYKIYAVTSGAMSLSLPLFLLVSIPARGLRFVIVALSASWASGGPLASWPLGRKRATAIALWTLFYAVYFAVKSR